MAVRKEDFHQPLDCETCEHVACVCNILKNHVEDCPFRVSATCPIAIPCEHGRDVCPQCDQCTCE